MEVISQIIKLSERKDTLLSQEVHVPFSLKTSTPRLHVSKWRVRAYVGNFYGVINKMELESACMGDISSRHFQLTLNDIYCSLFRKNVRYVFAFNCYYVAKQN